MGEKEEKEKKGDGEKKVDGEKKKEKEEKPTAVEVKLDLHCEGCAHKVKKLVRGLQGVESVSADPATGMLKVTGKVDPWQLKELLEAKTKKKVEFISPKDPPKKPKDEDKKKNKDEDGKDKEPKKEEAKPKPPEVISVVLSIRLHCDGCVHRTKKNIYKIKGVEEVTVDAAKNLVTVKGTMNAKTLPDALKEKIKRSFEIVPPKKEEGGGEKKEEKKGGEKEKAGGEKKEEEKQGDEKEKKDEEKKQEATASPPPPPPAAASTTATTMATTVIEANRTDNYSPYGGYPGYGYRVEMVHAPQMFSDENPNACSIM
ncbi:heavy metal-associated isoprenylated plant protein 3-like [Zingiber officinale]|uniref:heavy metal-associated isoprenylated plant protein 3-like n=1 Tax=Zingiber officinale TaxID=94328 RepID=UPI001C4C744A|nr:heavy metal-associated isoprenylated plant protein 3-like [Zingiber officinale]